MRGYRWSMRYRKSLAWVLLLAFALFLGAPSTVFCLPPNMSLEGVQSTGDPVGGERKDDRVPSGGGFELNEEGSMLSVPRGGQDPGQRGTRIIILQALPVFFTGNGVGIVLWPAIVRALAAPAASPSLRKH